MSLRNDTTGNLLRVASLRKRTLKKEICIVKNSFEGFITQQDIVTIKYSVAESNLSQRTLGARRTARRRQNTGEEAAQADTSTCLYQDVVHMAYVGLVSGLRDNNLVTAETQITMQTE
jgi:hypothetical protein